jgi:hypothetical protein
MSVAWVTADWMQLGGCSAAWIRVMLSALHSIYMPAWDAD